MEFLTSESWYSREENAGSVVLRPNVGKIYFNTKSS